MTKAVLLAALLTLGTRGVMASEQQLDASWTSFIEGLQRAQHSLTDPAAFLPQSTDRNLAEGYRYLLGHLGRMIEMEMRQDPRFPEFFRSMDMLRKWTAENPVASDGSRYYIVAHRDPGVAGWVDTTGLPRGSMAMRFIFRNTPEPGKMPTAHAQLVTLGELAGLLPADTPTVSITQRKAEIARRQSHIKMRWRGH